MFSPGSAKQIDRPTIERLKGRARLMSAPARLRSVFAALILAGATAVGLSFALGNQPDGRFPIAPGNPYALRNSTAATAMAPSDSTAPADAAAASATPADSNASGAVTPAAGPAAVSSELSRAQAIALVQGRYRARVVRTSEMQDRTGRRLYVFRLLSGGGKVWTVRIDAHTGVEVP